MPLVRSAVSTLSRRAPTLVAPGWIAGADVWSLFGARSTSAGVMVTDASALSLSAVYQAVQLIAGTIATLPLHTYERTADGDRTQIRLPSEAYIWDRPNPEVPRVVFWETVIGHAVLTGNAYMYVVTVPDSPRRRPVELWPIEPHRIVIGRTSTGEKVYQLDGTTALRDYVAGGEIVHVQGYGTDGLRGLSPIQVASRALGLGIAADEWAAKQYGAGSTPSGLLSSEQELTQSQANQLQAQWEENHKGPENAGRVAVLGKGTKWQMTTITPADMQAIEARQFTVNEVARIFSVPPEMLGGSADGSSSLTYANLEDRMQGFVTFSLMRWIARFEQTITDELLRPSTHYARFALGGLLRGNSTQRAAFYTAMVGINALGVDEVRELEDWPRREVEAVVADVIQAD